ncbi:MAG TPA: hypothetical protein VH436_05405 [Vicinamibacterales bacterium]
MMSLAVLVWLLVSPPTIVAADATTLRASGVIEQYDAATHTLSLASSTDITRFTLGPSVRVRQGRRSIEVSELVELIGYRASVRYLDVDGIRTVESIHVSERPTRPGP